MLECSYTRVSNCFRWAHTPNIWSSMPPLVLNLGDIWILFIFSSLGQLIHFVVLLEKQSRNKNYIVIFQSGSEMHDILQADRDAP